MKIIQACMCGAYILSLCFTSQLIAEGRRNALYKVFHHRVEDSPGTMPLLEVGKLILSFASEPHVEIVRNNAVGSGSLWQRTFFVPMAYVATDDCRQMLHAIARTSATPYKVSFDMVEKPVAGLQFTITYDHEKLGLTYAILESKSEYKRLIVTIYDKQQVKKIKESPEAVLSTASTVKPGIIVDCGHGGIDSGARGLCSVYEKDINLEVGTYVAGILSQKGFDVFLTRSADQAVALDERTLLSSRTKNASIFVSIHTNAASNANASGIETFFFDIATYCKGQDKQSRLTTALMHERCYKSKLLASSIHQSVLGYARRKQPDIIDRSVKQSFLQVLVGSSIPSALIELGFLTNLQECMLMKDKQYKMLLAVGICEGIVRYFNVL